jgi:hypothetical protein
MPKAMRGTAPCHRRRGVERKHTMTRGTAPRRCRVVARRQTATRGTAPRCRRCGVERRIRRRGGQPLLVAVAV